MPRAWTAPGSGRKMVGLNHTTWSVESDYDGADAMPAIEAAWAEMQGRPDVEPADRRFVELAVTMGAIPAQYLRYYYFRDEVLAELQARPTTRSEDILAQVPGLLGPLRRAGPAGRAGARPGTLAGWHLRAGAGARCDR